MRVNDEIQHPEGMRYSGGMPQPGGLVSQLEDALDDRVAEIVGEVLDQREEQAARPRPVRLAVLVLVVALAATLLLRHSGLAVCVAWLSCAVIYLAAARFSGSRGR